MVWCLLPGFSVYIYDGDMLSPGSRAGARDLPRAGHGQAWPATGPRGHELVLQQQHFLIQLRDEWLCFISCFCENNTVKSSRAHSLFRQCFSYWLLLLNYHILYDKDNSRWTMLLLISVWWPGPAQSELQTQHSASSLLRQSCSW